MGTQITSLNTLSGCAAETSAAAIIFAATDFGIPVSTTQTVTGAVAGTGLIHGLSGTKWSTLNIIFLSWLLTFPAAGFVSGLIYWLIE